jgi:hypothetical protein
MAFALNKKARKREKRSAKLLAAVADKFERERTASPEHTAMAREMVASRIKFALRKKRRRKKPAISN